MHGSRVFSDPVTYYYKVVSVFIYMFMIKMTDPGRGNLFKSEGYNMFDLKGPKLSLTVYQQSP